MDWSLFIFIAVVLYFAYRGYRKGLLRSLSRIVALVAAYVVTILYTEPAASMLESQYQLQGIVWFVTVALLLFIGTAIIIGILFWLLAKLLPPTQNGSIASALGGATIGLVIGVIAAVAVVWTFTFVRDTRPAQGPDDVPSVKQSRVEKLAGLAASKAVNAALSMSSVGPAATNLGTALVAAPAEVAQHVQQLSQSGDLNNLLGDPETQALLNAGDVEAVRDLPALRQLAGNPDMLALAESAGLLDGTDNGSGVVEAALASHITDIWQRTHRVRNDQRVQQILNDPGFQQELRSGNPLDLLTNARLLELADIIFADESAPAEANTVSPESTRPDNDPQPAADEEVKIFSWVDEDGRVHYSDSEKKP